MDVVNVTTVVTSAFGHRIAAPPHATNQLRSNTFSIERSSLRVLGQLLFGSGSLESDAQRSGALTTIWYTKVGWATWDETQGTSVADLLNDSKAFATANGKRFHTPGISTTETVVRSVLWEDL
jgi:hypothetical protein